MCRGRMGGSAAPAVLCMQRCLLFSSGLDYELFGKTRLFSSFKRSLFDFKVSRVQTSMVSAWIEAFSLAQSAFCSPDGHPMTLLFSMHLPVVVSSNGVTSNCQLR
ncbi:Cullin-7 [Trichinella spiralis]|uniref:Cullin-7 n=1 Tax=Trichinella spiralis TaxID=6334 RepID=A0ABR3KGN3_TRISP